MEKRLMNTSDIFNLRPAGRHVLAIGRELIKDPYSAVMELVKNSYDADSKDVSLKFELDHVRKTVRIDISDNGHGMSREVILTKWLIPSTNDKLKRKTSPKGRVMQGRKGLGRYAAAILGNNIKLRTISPSGEQTCIDVDWNDFEQAEFLDEVNIEVRTESTAIPPQTSISIYGDLEFYDFWDANAFNNLKFELKKLISPIHESDKNNKFDIFLEVNDSRTSPLVGSKEKIQPFPLLDYFDYKISGVVEHNGSCRLEYNNNKEKAAQTEIIDIELEDENSCGRVVIDIRVYDRESESLDNLIKKGLVDDSGNYLNKTQTKQLLNQSNGIGVYRNGFRIRPLGDPDFDWLRLNADRIQNPSLHIGSNQVIGFVTIESEESSNLKETSARDGLKDNPSYKQLIGLVKKVLNELESRRFSYRRKSGLTKTAVKIEQDFEKLFSFDTVKKEIKKRLEFEGISSQSSDEIFKILDKKEDDSAQLIEEIRQKVAIYQGQATLGKIINVVMHEGRRPVGFFSSQSKNLKFWTNEFLKDKSKESHNKVLSSIDGFEINAKVLKDLFSRLDPLSSGQRGEKKDINIRSIVAKSISVFQQQLNENEIEIVLEVDSKAVFYGWENDFYVILTNLIDNSIFWLIEKKTDNRKIHIKVMIETQEFASLDFRDNGPGISDHLIESNAIFEPEFSTKKDGIGIGLSIAGEAAHRNSLSLRAIQHNEGAYFRLQVKD